MKHHFIPAPTWRRHEWDDCAGQAQYCDSLHTITGVYTICLEEDNQYWLGYHDGSDCSAAFPTLEEAKAAAEEHYEHQFNHPDNLFGKKTEHLLNEGFEVCGVLLRKPGHCMTLSVEGKAVVHDPFKTLGAS
jgi:hypothetical protein